MLERTRASIYLNMNLTSLKIALKPFEQKSYTKVFGQLGVALSLVLALVILHITIYYNYSLWLWTLTIPLIAGLMVRIFIFFHDCAHHNFTPSRVANELIGHFIGFITLMPFQVWKYFHDKHHMHAGNLDHRDILDIVTLTVDEYEAQGPLTKFAYRVYRSTPFRFLVYMQFAFLIGFRLPLTLYSIKGAISIVIYNIFYGLIGYFLYQNGLLWDTFVMFFPIYYIMFGIGSYLFYLQHTFEDTYWETTENWSFNQVAFGGSSFWDVPKWLHWFSGNIGYHHIHHINSNIPNYQLAAAHAVAVEHGAPIRSLKLKESLTLGSCNLWDTKKKRMVNYGE